MVTINDQRRRLNQELTDIESGLGAAVAFLDNALRLLADPYDMYRRMKPEQRRMMNRVVFERVYVDTAKVGHRVHQEPFRFLIPLAKSYKDSSGPPSTMWVPDETEDSEDNAQVVVWSKPILVGAAGLEPTTSAV